MKKRGSISIETIIIIILALLVLIIVAASFTGGMKSLLEQIGLISKGTQQITLTEATTKCKDFCSNKMVFCSTSYQIENAGPRFCKDIVTCTEFAAC